MGRIIQRCGCRFPYEQLLRGIAKGPLAERGYHFTQRGNDIAGFLPDVAANEGVWSQLFVFHTFIRKGQ